MLILIHQNINNKNIYLWGSNTSPGMSPTVYVASTKTSGVYSLLQEDVGWGGCDINAVRGSRIIESVTWLLKYMTYAVLFIMNSYSFCTRVNDSNIGTLMSTQNVYKHQYETKISIISFQFSKIIESIKIYNYY